MRVQILSASVLERNCYRLLRSRRYGGFRGLFALRLPVREEWQGGWRERMATFTAEELDVILEVLDWLIRFHARDDILGDYQRAKSDISTVLRGRPGSKAGNNTG